MKQWDIEHKVGRNIMTHVTRGGEEAEGRAHKHSHWLSVESFHQSHNISFVQ